jgi:methionine biosynthesis protein MetW
VGFEDNRWLGKDQEFVWRHKAALELVQEEPVLDLGGGDGLFLSLLREKGFKDLKLLDISPVAAQKAREKGLEAEVVDITEPLPFDDKSFGTVCALDVLEHLYDPLSFLKEMARVGRSVVVVVPNFHYWKERYMVALGRIPAQSHPKRGHVYWFNYSVLEKMVKAAGLTIDSVLFAGFVRFGQLGGWLADFRPNLFAYAFAVRLK